MFYGMALKAGIFLLLCVGVYLAITTAGRLINNRINDYIATRETLTAKEIEVAELKARNDYLERIAAVTETFQQEKNALMAATHQSLLDARAELDSARNRWAVEDIRRRANTPEGNADLSARAVRATRRKKEQLETLSDWDTLYAAPVAVD